VGGEGIAIFLLVFCRVKGGKVVKIFLFGGDEHVGLGSGIFIFADIARWGLR
jgi:hypothetical protein